MTALSANKPLNLSKDGDLLSFPVYQAVHIYKNALVCVNSSGYLVPAADAAGNIFVGYAYEEADNSSGASGAISCKVVSRDGAEVLVVTSGAGQSSVGQMAYIADDQTINTTGGTNKIAAGFISRYESATSVWLKQTPFLSRAEMLEIPLGSVSAPGLPFIGDSDTGLYSGGADKLDGAVGGVQLFEAVESASAIVHTWGSAVSFGNSAPSLFRTTIVVPFNGKGTTHVWAANEHPKVRVVGVNFHLTEVPDASATTLTCKITDGTHDICADKTFTQGTDTVGKVLAGTIDTSYDNIAVGGAIDLVVGGTTSTLGRGVAYIDVIGE